MVSGGIPEMKISRKGLVLFLTILPLAGTAVALDGGRMASDAAIVSRSTQSAANDREMEASCREVIVDTDEGYGVTSRESRFVCDNNR